MSQTTSGLHAALSLPSVYSAFQNAIGAKQCRRRIITEYFRYEPGCRILDVGCGPADYLEEVEGINYFGINMTPPTLQQQTQIWRERAVHCRRNRAGRRSGGEIRHHSCLRLAPPSRRRVGASAVPFDASPPTPGRARNYRRLLLRCRTVEIRAISHSQRPRTVRAHARAISGDRTSAFSSVVAHVRHDSCRPPTHTAYWNAGSKHTDGSTMLWFADRSGSVTFTSWRNTGYVRSWRPHTGN